MQTASFNSISYTSTLPNIMKTYGGVKV